MEYRSDPELARATAVATRSAIKAAVAEQLSVSTYSRIIWAKCKFPAIQSMLVLRCETGGGLGRLGAAERDNLLRDTTPRTALEEGDGLLPSVERPEGGGRFRIAELTALFRSAVLPAQVEPGTRAGYYRAWRGVVTWLIAHDTADQGLPMDLSTLEAVTMEWLMAGASVSTIRNMWCAIEDGHRMFGHRPPFWEPGAFRRRLKALSSIRGSPTKLAFPIGVHHVSGHATPSLVSARCSGATSCWSHAEPSCARAHAKSRPCRRAMCDGVSTLHFTCSMRTVWA